MKLRAHLNPSILKAYLTSYVYLDHEQRWQVVRFCIDTGSPFTIIADNDRVLMGVRYSELRWIGRNSGIGGKVDIYEAQNPFRFEFIGEGVTYEHVFKNLKFMRGRTRQARQAEKILPSIIGMDFIMDCSRLTVEGRQCTLETRD